LYAPSRGNKYHLYCSRHNEGAEALVGEVKRNRKLAALAYSDDFSELPTCAAMLVYLNGRTWTSGAALAHEVEAAMRSGKQLVLAHEMPGIGQAARHALEFGILFSDNQTPKALVAAGIYGTVAVPLKGSAWRDTSMALLAKEIAATGQGGKFSFAPLSLPPPGAQGAMVPPTGPPAAMVQPTRALRARVQQKQTGASSIAHPAGPIPQPPTGAQRLRARVRTSLLLQRWALNWKGRGDKMLLVERVPSSYEGAQSKNPVPQFVGGELVEMMSQADGTSASAIGQADQPPSLQDRSIGSCGDAMALMQRPAEQHSTGQGTMCLTQGCGFAHSTLGYTTSGQSKIANCEHDCSGSK